MSALKLILFTAKHETEMASVYISIRVTLLYPSLLQDLTLHYSLNSEQYD